MLLVIGPRGGLALVDAFELRLIGMWIVGRYCGLYGGTCVVCRVVGML